MHVSVSDTHVSQVAAMMLVGGEEPPHPISAVFPARCHVVVGGARSDPARLPIHDHPPFAIRFDRLGEVPCVGCGISRFEIQFEPSGVDIHRPNRPLAERNRIVVHRQIADADLPAEAKGESG